MARIRIKDLRKNYGISRREMRDVLGGNVEPYENTPKIQYDISLNVNEAELANIDLQNMLQKQQQTMQMMSNISKLLADTSMAVVRKIG